ncbi:hypothetical protein [Nitrospira japonica]|uniref:hypothetical protein n=1 Tax=Nitrospira japonica TaxID=1325564 RepID=UPI0012DF5CFD|nr:hypothetical protein [Nitrospira japonica]
MTLHPGVLAVPDPLLGRNSFEEYLRKLLEWSSILNANWVALCISLRSHEVLAASNSYPNREDLSKSFQSFGIREYSINDIASVVTFILTKSMALEAETGIQDASWTKFQCTPPIHSAGTNDPFHDELTRLLVILSIHLRHLDRNRSNHVLAVATRPNNVSEAAVHADIDLIEFTSATTHVNTPLSLKESIIICDDHLSLVCALDECELISTAFDQESVARSIRIAWVKESISAGLKATMEDTPPFRIGNEFLTSVRDSGVLSSTGKTQKLMSTILDVLLRRNLQKSHALRRDSGGASCTVRRGTDKAIRWDIDYEHHLHVWDMQNGIPEFASVVPHHIMDIPS